jgi:heme exporter protein D
MTTLGPHALFIVVAYTVTLVVIVGLIAWVVIDHRAQQRMLADLEARGVTRHGDPKRNS